MKKTRKVVSLVICLAMLLSMMTAMTAGAAEVALTDTVFEKTFSSDADLPASGTYFAGNLASYCASGNYGISDGALYAKIAQTFASGQQMFTHIRFDDFTVGKYTLTAKVKASNAFSLKTAFYEASGFQVDNLEAIQTQRGSSKTFSIPAGTSEWTDITFVCNVTAVTSTTSRMIFYAASDIPAGTELYFDDIKIVKEYSEQRNTATVGVSGHGTVTNGNDAITNGGTALVVPNETLTLTVTPDEGYQVGTVTVDGTEVEVENGQVSVVMNADKAINVSFVPSSSRVVFYNAFDIAADTSALTSKFEFGGGTFQTVTDTTYGTIRAISIDERLANTSDRAGTAQRTFDIPSQTWEKGATYTISYLAKSTYATTTYPLLNFNCKLEGVEGNYNVQTLATKNIGTEWAEVSYTFTIADLPDSAETANGIVAWRHKLPETVPATRADAEFIYIQDIKIIKHAESVDATVAITGNGTVTYGAEPVENEDVISVAAGDTLTLNITPASGYQVAVTQDGTPVISNNNSNYTFTVNADTEIAITFTEIPVVTAAIVSEATFNLSAIVDDVPTVIIYSQLNNFNADQTVNYGIKLWVSGDADHKLTLNARDNTGVAATAAANAKFAIKAYGEAITADGTFVAQPFVGEATGSEITVDFE